MNMLSIKLGRGPSMGGAIGGIAAAAFGVFWLVTTIVDGGPPTFVGVSPRS